MPAPDLNRLHIDPSLLLNWLDDNLLMAGSIQNVLPPGLAWVTITPRVPIVGHVAAVNSSGRPVDVFELRSNGAGEHDSVRAYVCNYVANQIHSVEIGNAGDYLFTTNLNGCTFGIGSPALNGSRRVTHSNRGGNTIQQRQDTSAAFGNSLNGIRLLEPAQYRRLGDGASHQATVFGIRVGINWQFYFQSYTHFPPGQNYRVNGVFPI